MIRIKRKIALLSTLIVYASILGAVLWDNPKAEEPNSDINKAEALALQSPSASVPDREIGTSEREKDSGKEGSFVKGSSAMFTEYKAKENEGIIGKYAGKQLDNPADNIFTVELKEPLASTDKVWLSYELEGVSDYIAVSRSINDRLSTGGYMVSKTDKKSIQKEQINPSWLKAGENLILFSLPEGADYGYKIANLSIEVEKGSKSDVLVVNSTRKSYDNKVYISGFIQGDEASKAIVQINGKESKIRDGEFECIIQPSVIQKIEVEAITSTGKKYKQEVSCVASGSLDYEYAINQDVKRASNEFKKGVATQLALGSTLLKVNATALKQASKSIELSSLRDVDLVSLDMGLNNVTAEHNGYRFLPHGEHFAEGAKVSIKYDRTKIPNGYTEDDIKTYYFDQDSRHWVALERDSIDKKNQLIVSNTTHFTDMINGVIKAPESPETQGFAPTTMNDIKAADPTSKVQLIAAPSANNRGSANLSYSFEMPPARNGMSPSLGVQYSSDGGNGWLGEGWDLSVPSISIDTRWGVPRYDDAKETETYSMSGSMLVTMDDAGESSVAHRGDKINRKADRQFYSRSEGAFSKIIRKGSSPSNYTWEVTDKSGTKYTYGGEGAVLRGAAKTLGGEKDAVAEWKLSRIEELHGDYIEFKYRTVDETIRGSLTSKAIYLSEVHVGNQGSSPHTTVLLTSETDKNKKTNSGRYGFLTSSNKLLDKVEVIFEGETLRSYTFDYKQGAFNTNILTKINHIDSNGDLFASHDMDYYDDVKSTEGYNPFATSAETWRLHDDGIDAGFINPVANLGVPGFSDKASALGGSVTTATSASFYAGVGLFNGDMVTKSMTIGGSYSYSNSTTKGLSTLIDINGDGLADKVYQKGSSVYYRANISQNSETEVKYGDEIKIRGISKFAETKSTTNGGGAKVNPGFLGTTAVGGVDKSSTTSKTTVYFSDVNNDGLVDLVVNGKVYFNHIEKDSSGNLIPTFTGSSGDTPSPMMSGGVIDDSDTQVDPQEQEELVQNSPMLDVIRVWEAPFSGTIKIEGNVQLLSPTPGYDETEYEKADGVRIAIQVAGSEKWNKSIAKGDFISYPAIVNSVSVNKGQKVYFRVQSGTDRMSNGAFDQVRWSPVITYTDRTNVTNANGQGTAIYKASEGYVFSEDNVLRLNGPVNVKVTGTFEKPVTSDNITLRVLLSNDKINDDGTNNPSYAESVVYTKDFAWDETHSGDLSFNIVNSINGINLKFEVISQTNISLETIKWIPRVEYTVGTSTVTMPVAVKYTSFSKYLIEGKPYNLSADGNMRIEPKFSSLPALPPYPAINGKLLMAVKNTTGLLAKQEITIQDGQVTASSIINSLTAKAGNVWVEYYITDKDLFSKLGNPSAIITNNGVVSSVPINTFTNRDEDGFGITNRGWGQFVYNANDERYGNPIAESLLKLPQSENEQMDPVSTVFLPLTINQNDATQLRWIGQNPDAFIAEDIIASARLGDQDVVLNNPLTGISNNQGSGGSCIPGSGAFAVTLENKSSSTSKMVGTMGVTTSSSDGTSRTTVSFADMNGDGYPDIMTSNQVQFTNSRGGFDGEKILGIGNHKSKSNAKSIGYGGNPVHAASVISNSAKYVSGMSTINAARKGERTLNISEDVEVTKKVESAKLALDNAKNKKMPIGSLEIPWNEDETVETFMDVNGDGLPDKILSNKQVQLNLGYGFTETVNWDIERVDGGKSITVNAGLGYDFGGSSISAGFGLTTTTANTNFSLMDVNSDGLPDKVWKSGANIQVAFNIGNGFTVPVTWQGMSNINESASTAESLNAAYTQNIGPIPIAPPLPLALKISLNGGVNTGKTMNRTTYSVQDVDGDGYPEVVESTEDGKMSVYRSTIARTNKLRSVNNPLGGSFTIDYDRSLATYDHPGGKWVMKSVEVNDGLHDDGANMKTMFDYKDGRQERHEREFLGFGKVITKNIDTEATGTIDKVYRQAIQEYDVANIYTAGNVTRSEIKDAEDKKYSETINEYYAYKVVASNDNYQFTSENSFCTDRAAVFTPLRYTKSIVYEGEAEGLVANEIFYEYHLNGSYGNLKNYKYSDKGTLGKQGTGTFNYQTSVEYANNVSKHILGLPTKVQVKGSDGQLYRQTEAVYDLNFANHLTKVTQTLDKAGNKAVIDITYDKAGNIKQKTLPANSKGKRMWFKYLYDRDYNMYVERVEDAFGYRSEMEDYDYRYGIPLTTRDMNGYTLETTIDHLGRVSTITAPNEQVIGQGYTIKFEYKPEVTTSNGELKSLAYAITKHYDPQHPTDDLETVTFVDGSGRPVQVKKNGVITTTDASGSNPQDKKVMIVTGRAKFDPFGRVREAYYPVEEATSLKTTFNRSFDAVTPTKTQYDILDRALKTTLPDNSTSLMAYSKDNNNRSLITTVTDAMGGKQATFTNGSGLTVKTEQYSGPDGTITTRFELDPINQLLKAIDNGNNETVSTYDMAGRRTEVTHPASGTTTIKYDNASNMLSRQTANLKNGGKEITYEYEFNRLIAINYPDNPQNNVKYTYGNKNASHNRVGRLMLQEDATGAQEFDYDRLGNINKVLRTVIIPNQAIASYVTEWKYDSWNRLEEMIYPDGEKVSYSYNTAALLESVKGEKAYSYNYVTKLGYDKFEQRTYLKYCNGAETNYTYDPARRRLSNLMVVSGKETRKQIMSNAYVYDKVDNVLSVTNTAPRPTTGMGGQMNHTYSYDGLYRLKSATGTYAGAENKSAGYTLAMAYDNLHNIVSKKQDVSQNGIQFDGILKAGYDLSYTYSTEKPHQIANIKDANYRTEGDVANETITHDHAYQYDANGNLLYVNTAKEKADATKEDGVNEKRMRWDEENRLTSANVNGFISGYWYDAAGERVIKTSGDDEGMFVNDIFSGSRTQTNNFTAYINPYLVVSKGGQYTKHIYIGSQRIVSKLGDSDSYGQDPRRIEYAGSKVDGAKVDYAKKYKDSQQSIRDNYAYFQVEYNGKDNDDYVNGGGFCCDDTPKTKSFVPQHNDNPELFQYYYHSDHLGSSSLITNLDGEVVQHIEYVPFGEVFIEERNNQWNTPYLFNAKELDEETGLYYYGARYYDSRISVWLSTDPLQEKYPNISTYAYTFLNPVKYIDPTGMEGEEGGDDGWLSKLKQKARNTAKEAYNGYQRWYFENITCTMKNNIVTDILTAPYDARGREILDYWLLGYGTERNVSGGLWEDYMGDNGYIRDHLMEKAADYAHRMKSTENESMTFGDGGFEFIEIQNGYFTGYEMLHGTQYFKVEKATGVYNKETGTYTFNFSLLWRDEINPNALQGDTNIANTVKKLNPNAKDYFINIRWNQQMSIKIDEYSQPTSVEHSGRRRENRRLFE